MFDPYASRYMSASEGKHRTRTELWAFKGVLSVIAEYRGFRRSMTVWPVGAGPKGVVGAVNDPWE
jgi:hypothetical protein